MKKHKGLQPLKFLTNNNTPEETAYTPRLEDHFGFIKAVCATLKLETPSAAFNSAVPSLGSIRVTTTFLVVLHCPFNSD